MWRLHSGWAGEGSKEGRGGKNTVPPGVVRNKVINRRTAVVAAAGLGIRCG